MTTVDSWPKTLPMTCAWSWNSTTETHLMYIHQNVNICPEFCIGKKWYLDSKKKAFGNLLFTIYDEISYWHKRPQDDQRSIIVHTWTWPKPSLKIRTANAIFWICPGIFRDYGLKKFFFRNKTFLFFKIESWNFQHLFEIEFCETSQNFNSFSSFR